MSDEAMTEAQMRDSTAPTFDTVEELAAYVKALATREHDYGTCVYAMSLAATAAFNFMARALGVTGFQASCADMDILQRTRGYKHGFMILDGSNVLYPQYDLVEKAREFVAEKRTELATEARKMLKNSPGASPRVRAHWKELAATHPAGTTRKKERVET